MEALLTYASSPTKRLEIPVEWRLCAGSVGTSGAPEEGGESLTVRTELANVSFPLGDGAGSAPLHSVTRAQIPV